MECISLIRSYQMKTFCFSGSRQMVAVQYNAIYDAAARPVSMSYFISDIEWRKLNSSVINNWYLTCKRQYFNLGISFFGQNFTLLLQYGGYFTLYLFWWKFYPYCKTSSSTTLKGPGQVRNNRCKGCTRQP